jgi:hypothetical protein
LGFGGWGRGAGGRAPPPKSPIPNPQSPIPIISKISIKIILINIKSFKNNKIKNIFTK